MHCAVRDPPAGRRSLCRWASQLDPPTVDLAEDQLGIFNEASFYPAFAHDLKTAEESIVILSPYITSKGAARWADHLRAALGRGVGLRIISKPADEFGGASAPEVSETIDSLRVLGVAVDLRGRMHEKIALIDRRIAWHGSLNILSHSSTSELMIRSPGGRACQQLADLFCLPHRKGDERWKPSDPENPSCAECSAPTVLLDGRFGLYFECPKCGAKIDHRRLAAQREQKTGPQPERGAEAGSSTEGGGRPCPRPRCNGRLI